jgi:DUF4097 and DUF4098 domain-containing protein YvlB
METMSGDADCEGRAETIRCKTASGSIDLVSAFREAELQSVSGDVDVEVEDGRPKLIRVKTVSGDIDVPLPEGLGADARVKTVSGSITNRAAGEAPYRVEIQASTVSGDIDIA